MTHTESQAMRDGRAIAVANMLRSGWTGRAVSAALKVIDAGGGVILAMEAMRAAQREDSRALDEVNADA
jgi:hypothetical protein